MRLLVMRPGGRDPGPAEGDGKGRPAAGPLPMPGEGARRGGVARPKPESVSGVNFELHFKRFATTTVTKIVGIQESLMLCNLSIKMIIKNTF